MGRTLIGSGTWTYSVGSTAFYRGLIFGDTLSSRDVTETNLQQKIGASATFDHLRCELSSNSMSASSTVRLRKNGSDGNSYITIPASTTGVFYDTTNSDSLASGDLVCLQIANGSGSNNTWVGYSGRLTFSDSRSLFAVSPSANGVGGYLSYYIGFAGTSTTESFVQHKTRCAGTANNLRAYVSLNAKAVSATLVLRVNGSSASPSITIPASTTGWFDDTTNTATLASGDLINLYYSTSTTTGATNIATSQIDVSTTNDRLSDIMSRALGASTYSGTTKVSHFGPSSTVSDTRPRMPIAGVAKNLRILTTSNTANGDRSYTLYKDGSATAMTTTVPASTTGWFEDTTHEVDFQEGNVLYALLSSGGTSGTTTIANSVLTILATDLKPQSYSYIA